MVVLFVVMSSVYFATASGITSSNDGSHYALARTMLQNRAFTLNEFDDFAEGNDIAITGNGRYDNSEPTVSGLQNFSTTSSTRLHGSRHTLDAAGHGWPLTNS